MKKVLVCGAGGFIGGHLVKSLLEDGYDLVCPSRFVKGGRMEGNPMVKEILTRLASIFFQYFTTFPINLSLPLNKTDVMYSDLPKSLDLSSVRFSTKTFIIEFSNFFSTSNQPFQLPKTCLSNLFF